MGNTLQYGFLGLLFLSLPLFGDEAPALVNQPVSVAPDGFLDQPLPEDALPVWSPPDWRIPEIYGDCVQFKTFRDRLAALKKRMPRSLIFPSGLFEFVTEIDDRIDPRNTIFSPFQNERSGFGLGLRPSYRSFLNDSCKMLGMDCHYDPKRNVLVADFSWHRNDGHSSRELLQILTTTQPQPTDDYGWRRNNGLPLYSAATDPWRLALDALLSKPENYGRAWKLRFLDDTKGAILDPTPGVIKWNGWVHDENGQRRFIVIKYHPIFMMPGPTASFACYVFDSRGRLTDGALLSDRYEGMEAARFSLADSNKLLEVDRDGGIIGTISLKPRGIALHAAHPFSGDLLGKAIYRSQGLSD